MIFFCMMTNFSGWHTAGKPPTLQQIVRRKRRTPPALLFCDLTAAAIAARERSHYPPEPAGLPKQSPPDEGLHRRILLANQKSALPSGHMRNPVKVASTPLSEFFASRGMAAAVRRFFLSFGTLCPARPLVRPPAGSNNFHLHSSFSAAIRRHDGKRHNLDFL